MTGAWKVWVEIYGNFAAAEKTFEYTIMVIHEYLSLINDLEILNVEKEYCEQLSYVYSSLSN